MGEIYVLDRPDALVVSQYPHLVGLATLSYFGGVDCGI